MLAIGLAAIASVLIWVGIWFYRRNRARQTYKAHSIYPEALHRLIESGSRIELYDVRLPLDVLADAQIIPGAKRVSPGEIQENPDLFPKDHDTIVYCTCPSDETSQHIVMRVRSLGYTRVRFLRGGLDAWRAAGYEVRPYEDSFELNPIA